MNCGWWLAREARLSDAGIAIEQDDLTLAGLRLIPTW
jgi:hypothetical protein